MGTDATCPFSWAVWAPAHLISSLSQIKRYPCLGLSEFTGETWIFFPILWKNIIICILKGEMPLKMHEIIFFPEKNNKKHVCLSYLKFPDLLPETHLIFLFGLTK